MAAWLGPALKAVLPHLGTIVSTVVPVFTRKKDEATANQVALLQEQIGELQMAVSQNAEFIKELATQMQNTVAGLEQFAAIAEEKTRRTFLLALGAVALSVISLILVIVLVVLR